MLKVILDVDTGIDDSIALLYAVKKPEIEIVGITTSCGNVDARQAAENARRILDLAGAPEGIPIVIGADRPLEGEWEGVVAAIHGDNGLGNVQLPESGRAFQDVPVENFLNDTAEKYQGELTLITLGRLTNIARTLEKYPEFARNVRHVVMMGGTVFHPGNVSPVAEANIAGDPLACDKVFTSGMDITAVGLDVTMKTRLWRTDIEILLRQCREENRPLVQYMYDALDYYFRGNYLQDGCLDNCPVHDPLAVVTAVMPELESTGGTQRRLLPGYDRNGPPAPDL